METLISYILNVQKIAFLVFVSSFVGLIIILFNIDPYAAYWHLWLFFGFGYLMLGTGLILSYLSYKLILRKKLLTVYEVNKTCFLSMTVAGFGLLLFILFMTNQLTFLSLGLVLLGVLTYWLVVN